MSVDGIRSGGGSNQGLQDPRLHRNCALPWPILARDCGIECNVHRNKHVAVEGQVGSGSFMFGANPDLMESNRDQTTQADIDDPLSPQYQGARWLSSQSGCIGFLAFCIQPHISFDGEDQVEPGQWSRISTSSSSMIPQAIPRHQALSVKLYVSLISADEEAWAFQDSYIVR